MLLAEIVQRATGKSLRKYAEEQIFKPLGMLHTRFHDDHTAILQNRVYGYVPQNGGIFAGYRAEMIRLPDKRFSVALLCNSSSIVPTTLANEIAGIFLADQHK